MPKTKNHRAQKLKHQKEVCRLQNKIAELENQISEIEDQLYSLMPIRLSVAHFMLDVNGLPRNILGLTQLLASRTYTTVQNEEVTLLYSFVEYLHTECEENRYIRSLFGFLDRDSVDMFTVVEVDDGDFVRACLIVVRFLLDVSDHPQSISGIKDMLNSHTYIGSHGKEKNCLDGFEAYLTNEAETSEYIRMIFGFPVEFSQPDDILQ